MHVQPGETLTQVVRELDARSPDEQLVISIDEVAVLGEIADLDDPRFGRESGRLGYFDIYTFLWTVRPGIYFAEPYDPDRTPVLFIHGALGTPANFAVLAARLDRRRFQPWFFYYPSGARLEPVADFLSQLVARLQREHDLDRLAVVAHSMGGLVARSFILSHHARMRDDPVRLFVSVATPWAGVASARKGTQQSPIVVPSWHDVAEDSEFLRRLFFADPAGTTRRHLPEQIPFHLIFGVEDRTISLTSGIRWEAVRDAVDRWPLAYDHTAILRSPELTQILGEILGRELGD